MRFMRLYVTNIVTTGLYGFTGITYNMAKLESVVMKRNKSGSRDGSNAQERIRTKPTVVKP
ncbi:hypothetical protein Hanom_Chr00s038888g01773501 [Helianthus anomalus]